MLLTQKTGATTEEIKPDLRVRRPRVAAASAEVQALREGGLKLVINKLKSLLW